MVGHSFCGLVIYKLLLLFCICISRNIVTPGYWAVDEQRSRLGDLQLSRIFCKNPNYMVAQNIVQMRPVTGPAVS
jgi:hypothetical protein